MTEPDQSRDLPPEVDGETLEVATLEEIVERSGLEAETVSRVFDVLASIAHEQRPWRDPERLHDLYHREGKTQGEMAEELDTSVNTVRRWMDVHHIPTQRNRHGLSRQLELASAGDYPKNTDHDPEQFTETDKLRS